MLQPIVIDLFHGDVVASNWADALRIAGYVGVIHKATQGITIRDPAYAQRKKDALNAGLKWGAYDFNTGDPPKQQVDYFLTVAQPDQNTQLWLDFEDNRASNMTLDQAHEYLEYMDERTTALGIPMCGVYGGNRIKENVPATDQIFGRRPLWLCQYKLMTVNSLADLKPHISTPKPWSTWNLLQYTGDGIGPQPHNAPGITTQGVDLNVFDGPSGQLAANWTFSAKKPVLIASAQASPANQETISKSTIWQTIKDLWA